MHTEAVLRDALQRLVDAIWQRPNRAAFSIPARPDVDADCILADAITELVTLRTEAAERRFGLTVCLFCRQAEGDLQWMTLPGDAGPVYAHLDCAEAEVTRRLEAKGIFILDPTPEPTEQDHAVAREIAERLRQP